ncbi:MAG: GTP-binding protein [Candidatus Bathyarchaeota archaeon]|nr:GTP-binding protein [Candidatus Bathyarchaeota archaeon]
MPRFKQLARIQELMGRKGQIRNIGIIAHIDHGKTTLADSLLAGTGLLSSEMAGTARVLDYLQEEQRRKITIKTANISLLYKAAGDAFVVNLVDTPGHVDFTGKVTRALRAIDGVVVVVDAVEEIMAQTEVLTKQALEERVRPVLFINKVDRLITELQLNASQIEKKLTHIVGAFNDLIELHAEAQFKDKWKVSFGAGSVAVGSALHGWGFTAGLAQQHGVRFTDVMAAYKNGAHETLQKNLPAYAAIFDMTVKAVPDPKTAQAYRVEKIWKGDVDSQVGRGMVSCSDASAAVFCVTHVQPDQNGSVVATGRLFSGTIKAEDTLRLVNANEEALAGQVLVYMGAFKEQVERVFAGNVVALSLPGGVKAGETLVEATQTEGVVPFESIRYVSEPVVTVAVEPKNPKDLPVLLEAMDELAVEDPNLKVMVNRETGEYLLSGMGELHVEVALNHLKSQHRALEVEVSSPRVVYREAATRKGASATAKSPNKQNRFTVMVEPLGDSESGLVDQNNDAPQAGDVGWLDAYKNVLVDCTEKLEASKAREFIVGGFEFACGAGPLCGEPLRHAKVSLKNIMLSSSEELSNAVEVMHGVGKAVFASFLTTQPALLEPVYKTVISTPAELAGECTRILNSRRGKIVLFEPKGAVTTLTGYVPVAEAFGLSKELRSVTSGRAFWQSTLDRWEQVPKKLADKLTLELRRRKGLPLEVPAASRFMEEDER